MSTSLRSILYPTTLFLLSTSGAIQGLDAFPPKCSADLRGEATQPAGAPILLTITLTNNGEASINYVSLLPYPDANWFKVRIWDRAGKMQDLQTSNQQRGEISGGKRSVEPGESVDVLAVISPLPVGIYKLQVGNGKSLEIAVRDDPQLFRTREQDLSSKKRRRNSSGLF